MTRTKVPIISIEGTESFYDGRIEKVGSGYVLTPDMAPTPEQSDHTSIQLRIEHWKSKSQKLNGKASIANDENLQPKSLMPFAGNPRQPMPFGLAYNLLDYIELLDWTGRLIRDDKRGSIDTATPPALTRIGISPKHWLELCTHFEDRFKGLVGTQHSLNNLVASFGLTRKANRSNSTLLFCSSALLLTISNRFRF